MSGELSIDVGLGSCGIAAGGRRVLAALRSAVGDRQMKNVKLGTTGCMGLCHREVVVHVRDDANGSCIYGPVDAASAAELLDSHLEKGLPLERLLVSRSRGGLAGHDVFAAEHRVVLQRCGFVDPTSLDAYLDAGGYRALRRALLEMSPDDVIDEIVASGLRGRGGAGFPTGTKWRLARQAAGEQRVVICNADEGDPGAFMDRNLIEGDPFAILEGMTLASFAIGAQQGYVYVREEYPLAVERLTSSASQARARGLLGADILASGHRFDVEIRRGAGAFVCGEETALIASLEGGRGTPRLRPPFPVESGLFGRPTSINNVETFANVTAIVRDGPEIVSRLGVGDSRGTKVFSLTGDIRRTGMVEVPMGITIRALVEEIGGGSASHKKIKAVQIGGPSGGCIPSHLFDTPIDYRSLKEVGAIMGSGGLVVMDSSRCMVDIARYFLRFTQAESCGKCTFCRVGTKRMLEILDRLCTGKGRDGDLELLEEMSGQVTDNSLCGLGKSAPNPVMTTLRYFRDEYEAHLKRRCCPAATCRDLITFSINPLVCEGCTMCQQQCIADAISRSERAIHLTIAEDPCTRCGGCYQVCQFGAVRVR